MLRQPLRVVCHEQLPHLRVVAFLLQRVGESVVGKHIAQSFHGVAHTETDVGKLAERIHLLCRWQRGQHAVECALYVLCLARLPVLGFQQSHVEIGLYVLRTYRCLPQFAECFRQPLFRLGAGTLRIVNLCDVGVYLRTLLLLAWQCVAERLLHETQRFRVFLLGVKGQSLVVIQSGEILPVAVLCRQVDGLCEQILRLGEVQSVVIHIEYAVVNLRQKPCVAHRLCNFARFLQHFQSLGTITKRYIHVATQKFRLHQDHGVGVPNVAHRAHGLDDVVCQQQTFGLFSPCVQPFCFLKLRLCALRANCVCFQCETYETEH